MALARALGFRLFFSVRAVRAFSAALLVLAAPACRRAESKPASRSSLASSERAPSPEGARSRLHVVARRRESIELARGFAVAWPLVLTTNETGLHQDPSLVRGLGVSAWKVLTPLGTFPEDAMLLVTGDPDPSNLDRFPTAVLAWRDGRWAKTVENQEGSELVTVAAWKGGSSLAIEQTSSASAFAWRFVVARGEAGATLPSAGEAGPAAAARCKVQLVPTEAAGLPSGHLFVAGFACGEDEPKTIAVQRWEPASPVGSLDALPGEPGRASLRLALVSPREAYLAAIGGKGAAYLARFDGAGWALDAPPPGSQITDLSVGDDGTLWIAIDGDVFRRKGAGTWSSLALPPHEPRLSVWSLRATGAFPWLTATAAGESFLLGPTPANEIAELPSSTAALEVMTSPDAGEAGLVPGTSACAALAVTLGTNAGAASAEAPPELAAALAGLDRVRIVVDDGGATKTLVATVPDVATGRRVVRALEGKTAAPPRLVCRALRAK